MWTSATHARWGNLCIARYNPALVTALRHAEARDVWYRHVLYLGRIFVWQIYWWSSSSSGRAHSTHGCLYCHMVGGEACLRMQWYINGTKRGRAGVLHSLKRIWVLVRIRVCGDPYWIKLCVYHCLSVVREQFCWHTAATGGGKTGNLTKRKLSG